MWANPGLFPAPWRFTGGVRVEAKKACLVVYPKGESPGVRAGRHGGGGEDTRCGGRDMEKKKYNSVIIEKCGIDTNAPLLLHVAHLSLSRFRSQPPLDKEAPKSIEPTPQRPPTLSHTHSHHRDAVKSGHHQAPPLSFPFLSVWVNFLECSLFSVGCPSRRGPSIH